MCETIVPVNVNHHYINSYGPKFDKSITEPDNGHKTEHLIKLDYKTEEVRLRTFENWESEAVSAVDLAKAGFYYLNNPLHSDLVKCAFCNAEICSWEEGDNALDEHLKWSPNCPYAREQCRLSNRQFDCLRSQQPSGQDVCGSGEFFGNSIPESETFRLLSNMVKNYDDVKTRLESFSEWPKSSKQKPEALAEAGFFYRGVEDHAICFKCSGALRDWKDDDDPWEQHALWFPKCKFLLTAKGPEFVEEVQRKFKSDPSLTKEEENEKSACEPQDHSLTPDESGIVRCKLCELNERNVIFMPCKHILACVECSRQIEDCPVCRNKIEKKMRVFLS